MGAGMGSATIFFWLEISNVNKKYRTALAITGLVTAIATYHYFRIFNSWNDAFNVKYVGSEYQVFLTGQPFNDAYRYVDWVLTVPLLLIELILVMGLPAEETVSKSWNLGVASAIMVALSLRVHHQDDGNFRRHGDSRRADRLLCCGRRRKGGVRRLDLVHCFREKQGRGRGAAEEVRHRATSEAEFSDECLGLSLVMSDFELLYR